MLLWNSTKQGTTVKLLLSHPDKYDFTCVYTRVQSLFFLSLFFSVFLFLVYMLPSSVPKSQVHRLFIASCEAAGKDFMPLKNSDITWCSFSCLTGLISLQNFFQCESWSFASVYAKSARIHRQKWPGWILQCVVVCSQQGDIRPPTLPPPNN